MLQLGVGFAVGVDGDHTGVSARVEARYNQTVSRARQQTQMFFSDPKKLPREDKPLRRPDYLFQFWTGEGHGRGAVPIEVYKQARLFAPTYTHVVLDDDDAVRVLALYPANVTEAYTRLPKHQWKSDLLRYCILWMYGGVYLDIETIFTKPLTDVFAQREIAYTVLGFRLINSHKPYLFASGFLAVPPRMPIFRYVGSAGG